MKTANLRRWLLRMLVLASVVFCALIWLASSRLICPERRQLQDYHQEILANAAEHGMAIQSFNAGVVPCLLCEPAKAPGKATKGNAVRAQLEANGVPLRPWGEIRATLVLLHGHTGCKEDMLPVAERFCAAGFRCLLLDLPGHGQHPSPFARFGLDEATLPEEVLLHASTQFNFSSKPAALFGLSQGGAIAIQAAARPGEQWFAIAEISSFASLDHVVEGQARRLFGPFSPLASKAMSQLVYWRAHYVPSKVRPLDAAANLAIPALIGHGDADTYVSLNQAKELFSAIPSQQKQFLSIPGAGHHTVLITSAPVYATLCRFFTKSLP